MQSPGGYLTTADELAEYYPNPNPDVAAEVSLE
jgi:hypothetical protein